MKKSDFLDELRLEVGLAYDYAQNSKDFLLKVVDTLYEFHLDKRCVFTIFYTNCNDAYVPLYILGEKNYNSKVNKGIGFISLCARNIAVFVKKHNEQTILAPIHIEDELKYVLSVTMCIKSYVFTQEDIVFTNELIRFIEAKHKEFYEGKGKQ